MLLPVQGLGDNRLTAGGKGEKGKKKKKKGKKGKKRGKKGEKKGKKEGKFGEKKALFYIMPSNLITHPNIRLIIAIKN